MVSFIMKTILFLLCLSNFIVWNEAFCQNSELYWGMSLSKYEKEMAKTFNNLQSVLNSHGGSRAEAKYYVAVLQIYDQEVNDIYKNIRWRKGHNPEDQNTLLARINVLIAIAYRQCGCTDVNFCQAFRDAQKYFGSRGTISLTQIILPYALILKDRYFFSFSEFLDEVKLKKDFIECDK